MLKLLSVFIKLANHPALFLEGLIGRQNEEKDEIDDSLLQLVPSDQAGRRKFYDVKNCGKMGVLDDLLNALYQSRRSASASSSFSKVLLFSQSVRLLDIIESHVGQKGYRFLRLDGTTKPGERQRIVDEFNRDEEIFLFLISTK